MAHTTLPCSSKPSAQPTCPGNLYSPQSTWHLCPGLSLGCGALLGLPRERMEKPELLHPEGQPLTHGEE